MDTAQAPDGPACTPEPANPTSVIILLMAGTFLAPLDSSIVNIALPAIAEHFDVRLSAVSWVATAYLLTNASLVLTMGRLGDIRGLKKVYIGGFVVFGVGSVACALAWSLPALIVGRVIQAVGASMMFATGPALVTRTFPPNRRGWALGWLTLSVSAGLMVGPVLGGILLSAFGWPSIFLINVPLAIVVVIAARRMLPDDCPNPEPFDIWGAVVAAAALTVLLLGMSEIDRRGLDSAFVLGSFAVAAVLGALFVWIEGRVEHPMVDLDLFRSRRFAVGIAAPILAYMSLFAVTFTMPFYLVSARGVGPALAGLILTATPLAMAIFAPLAGRLSDRVGARGLSTGGLVWMAVVLAAMSGLATDTELWVVAALLFLLGMGVSSFMTPNAAAVLRATPRERVGVGSALIGQARSVGMALGIGVTAAVIGSGLAGANVLDSTGALSAADAQLFVDAMGPALMLAGGISMVAALISWMRGPETVEG
jgi:EmrB/QacA subfamily drug resistance transporter